MIPNPTSIYRIIHVENLPVILQRGGLHAPIHTPNDGLQYRTIHNVDIQLKRQAQNISCGPRGVIHDYVSFYFGPRSPMLYQLHTGRVEGYSEGQEPLIYLVSTVDAVTQSGLHFVFSDGHGIAVFSQWFDDLINLAKIDWGMVYADYWADTVEDPDRQRRKQAEFLIYKHCAWELILEIGVINDNIKNKVIDIMEGFPNVNIPPVNLRSEWYY